MALFQNIIPIQLRIPNKFQLGGATIKVERVEKCSDTNTDTHGQAVYQGSKIELKQDDSFSDDYREYIFLHELVHLIFDTLMEDELSKNEKLVGQIAELLQQAIKTME